MSPPPPPPPLPPPPPSPPVREREREREREKFRRNSVPSLDPRRPTRRERGGTCRSMKSSFAGIAQRLRISPMTHPYLLLSSLENTQEDCIESLIPPLPREKRNGGGRAREKAAGMALSGINQLMHPKVTELTSGARSLSMARSVVTK